MSPIHYAAFSGDLETFQLLFNITKDKNPISGTNGITPLHIAAGNGNFEICKIIINDLCNKSLSPEDGIEICDDHDRTRSCKLFVFANVGFVQAKTVHC